MCRGNQRESGYVMLMAMVFMLMSFVMITAALTFSASALKQGLIAEDRTTHLYAADAGVETAWQRISTGNHTMVSVNDVFGPYPLNLDPGSDRSSSVTIQLVAHTANVSKTYRVNSLSQSTSGKTTEVETLLVALPGEFLYALDNVITTQEECEIKSGVPINGWVQLGSSKFPGQGPDWGDNPNAPPATYGVKEGTPDVWPSSTLLTGYYQNRIDMGLAELHDGNWLVPGDLTLTRTVYVNGDFTMKTSGSTLNLNGYTLFVDGNVDIQQVDVNPPGTGKPGAIVATGNISFWPNQQTGDPENGVLIMCLGDAGADFRPGEDFYGWIVAQNGVEVRSGEGPSYNWVPNSTLTTPLDFPGVLGIGGSGEGAGQVKITTWKIIY